MSLKTKLTIASCGPLIVLLIVGLISIRTITESSKTLERIFRENYDSVAAGITMKSSVEQIDRIAAAHAWGAPVDRQGIDSAAAAFSRSLEFQQGNITLPGEREITNGLAQNWSAYRSAIEQLLDLPPSGNMRRDHYLNGLLPRSDQVRNSAQQIININLDNMVSTDGQVRRQAAATNRTLIVLVLSGFLLAAILVIFVGPSIVRPISNLTNSVKEIQRGNLDLLVKARSGDEIGQLASAFNEMTSTLRDFRRTDKARLIRTQKATLSALNSLSDAVIICNPGGEIELANETALDLFGHKPGTNIQAIRNEKVIELFDKARRDLRPIRSSNYGAAIQIFRQGEEHFFLPEAVPILDGERLVGMTLIFSDITRLRKLDEVKSGLISTVSHELKTPLTSIRLATHVLLSEKLGSLTPKQTELIAAAREDSDRLYRIIENLLDISQMESGGSRLELLPVSTEQVLLSAVEEMRSAFAERGVALVLDMPGDVPQILADRFRLEIVFANLLKNALKFTPSGGRAEVSAREQDGEVLLAVEDSGKGIPQEYLVQIFDKFFRVPGHEQQGESGLGLAIVKEIVEAHGSSIDVTSTPGKGTRFSFALKAVETVTKKEDVMMES